MFMRSYRGLVCCFAIVCGGALAADAPLELRSDRLALRLGREERGGVVSLKTAEGVELAAVQKAPRLFTLTFSQKAETPRREDHAVERGRQNLQR